MPKQNSRNTRPPQYEYAVHEPDAFVPGVIQRPNDRFGKKRFTDPSQVYSQPAAPDISRAVAMPIISQAAIDDYNTGDPHPVTDQYLGRLHRQFGKGWAFDDWIRKAIMVG